MKTKPLILSAVALLMSINLLACEQTQPNTTNPTTSTSNPTTNQTSVVTSVPTTNTTTTVVTPPPVVETPYDYQFKLPDTLPRIDINTLDGTDTFATAYSRNDKVQGKIDYVDSKVSVSDCDSDYQLTDVDCQVKARGNYTLNYEKKPIRLKFNKKQKMLGLNDDQKFKSWVLLADFKDASMLKNQLSFYLGHQLLGSDGLYSSDFQYVHLYINNNYWGMYLLCEQQQPNAGRLSLTEPEDDYTGTDIGYMFEYDSYYSEEANMVGGDPTFTVAYTNGSKIFKQDGNTTTAENPGYTLKNDIYSDNQINFISNYVRCAYKIAYRAVHMNELWEFNADGSDVVQVTNPGTIDQEAVCRSVLNVESFVDMFLYSEIVKDQDISWSSFYLSSDHGPTGDKKITLQAPWDKDNAFGGKSGYTGYSDHFAGNSRNPWLTLLAKADWFQELVKEKWQDAHKHGVFTKSLQYINDFSDKYVDDFARNFTRWPRQMGNPTGELDNSIFGDDQTQKDPSTYLYSWLHNRYNFMNDIYGNGNDILDPVN